MKYAAVIVVPAIAATLLGLFLYNVTGNFTDLFTHDVCEAHTHAALIPFICVVAFAVAFLPGLFYMAAILFPMATPAEIEAMAEANDHILTTPAPAALTVGQIFEGAGARFRVKAIKTV